MYKLIKRNIMAKNYNLTEMTERINRFAASGKITPEEQDELLLLAQEQADMTKGYASLLERVEALEAFRARIEQSGTLPDVGGDADEEYPAWRKPTGAHDAYYTGMKMTYDDGKRYECIAPEGYGVTFGPDVLPGMWQLMEG